MIALRNRRGIASFEMVVFLPSLIFLALILFFFGGFGIQMSKAIVDARHEAWSKRYVDGEEREFESTPFLLRGDEKQYADGEAERKVEFVKFFKDWAVPKSKHLVLAGTWDHEDDLLDASPNMQTAFKVAGIYAASPLVKAEADFNSMLSILNHLDDPKKFLNAAKNALMGEMFGMNLDPSNLTPF